MAEITKARTGQFMRRLFELLLQRPEGMQANEALHQLGREFSLSEYEAGDYASGGRRFEKIVRFATVDTVKAGWLVKEKGTWTVTAEGVAALQNYQDPAAFYGQAVLLYRQWKHAQSSVAVDTLDDAIVENTAGLTLEQAEEQAWSEIALHLAVMPPFEFQELVASLLRAMGYHIGWIAPPGKDGGVDIVAFNDPLGTRPPRIKVQVKRNANSPRIDVMGLRSFMAVLGDGDVGLYVALSGFTRDADLEARQSHRRITLIGGNELVELWTKHYQQLDDEARRRLPLKPVWFLAGDD
ncbi:TPA: restriction endonuclease [Stenotrophomonas maltophilia]|nr:restriction endonuclease [Stenotrophomonas maltophilia]